MQQPACSDQDSTASAESSFDLRTESAPVSPSQAHDYNVEGPGTIGEMYVPYTRPSATRAMGADRNNLSKQLINMQHQLSSVMEGQERLQVAVGHVHANVDKLVAHSDRSHKLKHDSSTVSTLTGSPDGQRRGRKHRSHNIFPNQKKLIRELSCKDSVVHVHTGGATEESAYTLITSPTSRLSIQRQNSPINDELVDEAERLTKQTAAHRRSLNSFADKSATEDDDMRMLQSLFAAAESAEERIERMDEQLKHPLAYYFSLLKNMDNQNAEIIVDAVIGVVITLNAIFIGISMDNAEDGQFEWIAIDVGFSALFFLEIGFKVWMYGLCKHFCGSSRYTNIFDACIIIIDLLQLLLVTAVNSGASGFLKDAPSASLFRIVRLGKLARMLRLLKSSVFKDLLAMLQGMLGGMATLGWSMILFIVAIYVAALLFRELFGKGEVPNVSELFDSVPRSMFTTFRCSFGDCSSYSGVPIFEYVNKEYGGLYSLGYCLFVFVITIGVFNVISAIFVESTMAAASALQMQKKKGRLRDHTIWCTNVAVLVRRLMEISTHHSNGSTKTFKAKLTESLDEVYRLEVPCAEIDELAQDPEAIAALAALDIVPEDRDYLSDILDPDNGGTINVIELVEGLRRLRGDPRRSDIVTVNLMLRSVQRDVVDIADAVRDISAHLNIKESPWSIPSG